MDPVPLNELVIFFMGAGVELTNNADLLNISKEAFSQGTYWKVTSSDKVFVVLKNVQTRETKTITYAMLGKIFSFNTEKILLMHVSEVPKIIFLP